MNTSFKPNPDIKHIYYCACGKNGSNFGDMITPYIYQKITGNKPIKLIPKDGVVVFGAGSIMGSVTPNAIVWGTGIMFKDSKFCKPLKILSVRGPLTRKRCLELGHACPEIYGDIGLILPKFYNPVISKKYKIGMISHYVDYDMCKSIFGANSDISIIDITEPVEKVIDRILECELTMSSSLHGIITSHAYSINCCWMRMSNKIAGGNTKFWDYYQSVGINNNMEPLMVTKLISSVEIISKIKDFPNPLFPIKTDHILELCPFKL